ncbi:hypothetical protein HBI80_081500 [Parastagonospora nodorum]|nr:hypothetical protein HBI80_081500 [Parastagonospora nodorum]
MQNQALRGLKDVLKEHYTKKSLEKMSFFVSDSLLEGVPDLFSNAVFRQKFLFGTTSFPDKDEVKMFLTKVFSDANWQLGNERRPIILVGQGAYQDYKIVKSSFGINLHTLGVIDLHALDVIDVIQSKYIAKDAGLVSEGSSVSLPNLLKGFGLDPIELALHNVGNDAVATLLVGLLASLNDKLHPQNSHAPVDLIAGRHIADIVASAAQGIKANSKPFGDCLVYCHRCESTGQCASACTVPACVRCDSSEHVAYKCTIDLRMDECAHCSERTRPSDKCRDKAEYVW